MKRVLALVAALAAPAAASAFCGTYVSGSGDELYSGSSKVAIARVGNRTTLTMANDFSGALEDFAMVIPVPSAVGQEDVNVLNRGIFKTLEAYTKPRLVNYTCDDFQPRDQYDYSNCDDDYWESVGCTDSDSDSEGGISYDGTTVEDYYTVGEYEIFVLSATDSSGLMGWLGSEGFAVSADAEDALGEYIEQGVYFLAARVKLSLIPDGETTLSPLQFSYESEVFGLPIKLGTLNSPGEQDLLVYALTTGIGGKVGISNYPEYVAEDECMIDLGEQSFAEYAEAQFDAGSRSADRRSWMTEYAWPLQQDCDPCTDGQLFYTDIEVLGLAGEYAWESYLTRLHVRFSPSDVDQDLMLYETSTFAAEQIRYINYNEELEYLFPVCGVGMVPNPGECEFREPSTIDVCAEDSNNSRPTGYQGGGCSTSGGLPSAFGLGLIGLLMLRRRSQS